MPPAQKPQHPAKGNPRVVRVAGHMGEFVQGRLGPAGPVVLITLPCPPLAVTAQRRTGAFALECSGLVALDRARAAALLRALDLPVTGRFLLRGELPPGGGAGASTAALVALARAAGADEARLAAACVAVEGASDPLMYAAPERLVWASRRGVAVSHLPALPPLEVVAGFLGPPQRTDPADVRFADVADLLARWPLACTDADSIARVAAESARRTLALRGPQDDPTEALARRLGAAGFAIGHTGPARALLFRPGTPPAGAEAALCAAGFRGVLSYRIGGGNA
ncbi:propanediol utilization protein PduX [Paracoccus sanguinis]|uniref:Propanediol utilization protein PduX n=1 Tax=Paracoccus sanguinis TaxID=1545044 RepID=A0A099GH87_9RHOB|nr:propanediol utilization protein PduX [Paracoccus sanguinis]KGJ22184.1 propanediol utilization protein PduX [Paracoccus sanguinis]